PLAREGPGRVVMWDLNSKTMRVGDFKKRDEKGSRGGRQEGKSSMEMLWEKKLGSRVRSVAFAPKMSTLACGADDGIIRICDVDTGKELTRLVGHQSSVNCLGFSPDGRFIASGGADLTVRLWEVVTRKELVRLVGHQGEVTCVSFSRDGKGVMSGS